MGNPFLGALLSIGGFLGYYLDYVLVRFLFRLGHGIADWLGGPEVVGTGIGLLLTVLLLSVILGLFIFSTLGIYVGWSMMVGRPFGFGRRWQG